MRIGLIILSFNQFEGTTRLCLDSLLPQLNEIPAEIHVEVLVFDNGSSDGSDRFLSDYLAAYPSVTLHLHPTNLGFGGGMNEAARKIAVDWLVLIGSDIIFPPKSLSNFLAVIPSMEKHIAMVGPTTNEAGNAQRLNFSKLNSKKPYQDFLSVLQRRFSHLSKLILPLYQVGFFCVAVRKNVWDELGGLDLVYGRGYYEDFDFSMRAKKVGYQFALLEDVVVYHQGSASFKQSGEIKALMRRNKKIFEARHPEAELRHLRLDNFKLIENYLTIEINPIHLKGIMQRLNWRLEALEEEMPRSFFKRLLWKMRVAHLKNKVETWKKQFTSL